MHGLHEHLSADLLCRFYSEKRFSQFVNSSSNSGISQCGGMYFRYLEAPAIYLPYYILQSLSTLLNFGFTITFQRKAKMIGFCTDVGEQANLPRNAAGLIKLIQRLAQVVLFSHPVRQLKKATLG